MEVNKSPHMQHHSLAHLKNSRPCRPTLEQVEQAVKFKFSQPENSTLEQVAQAVKFKVLVQN